MLKTVMGTGLLAYFSDLSLTTSHTENFIESPTMKICQKGHFVTRYIMTNQEVVDAFVQRKKPPYKSPILSTRTEEGGISLYCYDTPLVFLTHDANVNARKYSSTTSKIQSSLIFALEREGIPVNKVNGPDIFSSQKQGRDTSKAREVIMDIFEGRVDLEAREFKNRVKLAIALSK